MTTLPSISPPLPKSLFTRQDSNVLAQRHAPPSTSGGTPTPCAELCLPPLNTRHPTRFRTVCIVALPPHPRTRLNPFPSTARFSPIPFSFLLTDRRKTPTYNWSTLTRATPPPHPPHEIHPFYSSLVPTLSSLFLIGNTSVRHALSLFF